MLRVISWIKNIHLAKKSIFQTCTGDTNRKCGFKHWCADIFCTETCFHLFFFEGVSSVLGTWKTALSALFQIHDITDAHDWLVSFWLTGERDSMPKLPTRKNGQFSCYCHKSLGFNSRFSVSNQCITKTLKKKNSN